MEFLDNLGWMEENLGKFKMDGSIFLDNLGWNFGWMDENFGWIEI